MAKEDVGMAVEHERVVDGDIGFVGVEVVKDDVVGQHVDGE